MIIPVRHLNDLTPEEKKTLFKRSEENIDGVLDKVKLMIQEVRMRGDEALRDYALQFDHADLKEKSLLVSEQEYEEAEKSLSKEIKATLQYCIENVKAFHKGQKPEGMTWIQVQPGILAGERPLPIESAGLYVPRGRGSFPSMVYMQAIPAQIAGVKRVVMVSPPLPDGSIDPGCLYAARQCGVHEVYKVGGAQAIAALAYGTETIAPVVKINGPGSMFVAAAKRLVYSQVDVGLPAGPSESAILADETAKPWRVALDLMVEAEHGSDSCALLITTSENLAKQVSQYIGALVEGLQEPRKTFVKDVFSGYGAILVCQNIEEGAQAINDFAPEHLSLQTADPFQTLSLITNAGEILLGENLPFSAANYATGPNAILPTGGKAKTYSPTSVRDFIKYNSVVYTTLDGYNSLKGPVTQLADYEGFQTHADAFRKRGDRQS